MELKIISDGTHRGTKVVDSKTGEIIEGIRSIKWSICYDEFAVAIIEIDIAHIEAISLRTKIIKPIKKRLGIPN